MVCATLFSEATWFLYLFFGYIYLFSLSSLSLSLSLSSLSLSLSRLSSLSLSLSPAPMMFRLPSRMGMPRMGMPRMSAPRIGIRGRAMAFSTAPHDSLASRAFSEKAGAIAVAASVSLSLGFLTLHQVANNDAEAGEAEAGEAADAAASLSAPQVCEKWDAEVDFIVVGAGSAGCAVAARLCEKLPKAKTLLVEAGWHDDLPQIQTAVDYFGKVEAVFGSKRDWAYASEPQAELKGRALYWPRGKVVGGCSSFNTMVYLRGDPSDYDHWAEALGPGFEEWGSAAMTKYFRRAESHPLADGNPTVHGASGPMTVAPLNHPSHHPDDASHPVTRAFCAASMTLGHPRAADFAAAANGVAPNDVNAKGGRRCNTSSYLKLVGAYPTAGSLCCTSDNGSLDVWLGTTCRQILFGGVDSSTCDVPRAVGVELELAPRDEERDGEAEDSEDPGSSADEVLPSTRLISGAALPLASRRVRVRARKEIILCGGAVNSPQLLMVSGVGDQNHLREVGVKPVVNLPGVGQGLKDHLHIPMCYRVSGGVKPHSHSNICEGTLFCTLGQRVRGPDLQVHCGTIFFEPDGFSPKGEGFTLTPSLIRPASVGEIRLSSADPTDRPIIQPHYLEEKADLDTLVSGIKHVRRIGKEMMKELGCRGKEMYPGPAVRTDAQLEEYVRSFVGTMYHPACTARAGRADDRLAVLDANMCVRGCTGLRVADASAMPFIVGANTNATCIALGEKAADLVIRRYVDKLHYPQ